MMKKKVKLEKKRKTYREDLFNDNLTGCSNLTNLTISIISHLTKLRSNFEN